MSAGGRANEALVFGTRKRRFESCPALHIKRRKIITKRRRIILTGFGECGRIGNVEFGEAVLGRLESYYSIANRDRILRLITDR